MAKTQQAEREQVIDGEILEPEPKRHAVTVTPTVDKFISELLPSKSAKDLWSGLPSHISKELFKRNLFNAITHNGKLMDCNKALLYREISKAAALGLLLDPLLGEAYLIIDRHGVPQLRVGYKGFIKLARQSGNITGVWCHDVHENDEVIADLGFPKRYSHKPVLFGERGSVVGYTAVVAYKDGSFDFEPMSLQECLSIRDRSDAWKASSGGTKFKTPWHTDESEMCKKTVFNRLMKRQDRSPEMRQAIEIENEAEFPHMIEHDQTPRDPAPQRKAPAPPPEEAGGQPDAGARDLASDRSKAAKAAPARGPRSAPKPPEAEAEVEQKPAEPAKMSTKELLAWVEAKFAEVTPELLLESPDLLGNIWENEVEPKLAGLFPVDADEARAIMRQHEKRLEP